MIVKSENGGVRVGELEFFDVTQTFDCGQCFRFTVEENRARGYAFGREVTFTQLSESEIYIYPCTETEYYEIWERYLSLDTDYAAIRKELAGARPGDDKLATAMETGKGIRILRQEPWETLCSFIISQNNNIPRIKKIIDSLCRAGAEQKKQKIGITESGIGGMGDGGGASPVDFPSPEVLAEMGTEGIFALRTGFRAAYLYDAACKVIRSEVKLEKLFEMSCADAAAELCRIKGVGPKVAACTLLFGFDKLDAFPIDVWVKRVMTEYYGDNIDASAFGRYAGLAQQYLFYHRRYIEG